MSMAGVDQSGAAAPSSRVRRWQRVLLVGWVTLLVAQLYLAWTAIEVRSLATLGSVLLCLSGIFGAVEGQLVSGHRARRPLIAVAGLLLALSFAALLTALARRAT